MTDSDTMRVLVVDDTLLYRLLVKEAIGKLPGFEVVGMAENGQVALERVAALQPDLVLLDIEMPVMNGLEFLDERLKRKLEVPVLVVSSVTKRGGKIALEALDKGALDFITKPEADSADVSRAMLFEELEKKLLPIKAGFRGTASSRPTTERRMYGSAAPTHTETDASGNVSLARAAIKRQRFELITIAVSTGGPQALTALLPKLPDTLPPIAIVQHMPGPFITALAEKLDKLCAATVLEAQHEMKLARGHIYIAPGGWQMDIAKQGLALSVQLHDAPAEHHCKPAADFLFRGAAQSMARSTLGIVLTGMGADGAQGLAEIRNGGGMGLAQDEASSTVYGMPKQAVRLGGANFELSLDDIAEVLRGLAS